MLNSVMLQLHGTGNTEVSHVVVDDVFSGVDVLCVTFTMKLQIFTILCALVGVNCVGNTLVLLDNQVIRETHSIFFKSLQGMSTLGNSRLCTGKSISFCRSWLHVDF